MSLLPNVPLPIMVQYPNQGENGSIILDRVLLNKPQLFYPSLMQPAIANIVFNRDHFLYDNIHSVCGLPLHSYIYKALYKTNQISTPANISHTFYPGKGLLLSGGANITDYFPTQPLTSEFTQIVYHHPTATTVTRAIGCSGAYTSDVTKIITTSYGGTTNRGLSIDAGTNNTAIWMHYAGVYVPILRITVTINEPCWYVMKTKSNVVYLSIYNVKGTLLGSASTSTCTGNPYSSSYGFGINYNCGSGYTHSLFTFNKLLTSVEEQNFILDPYAVLE